MSEAIRVVVRIKPHSDESQESTSFLQVNQDETIVSIHNPQLCGADYPVDMVPRGKQFDFSRIYSDTCSQHQIFDDLAVPTITEFLRGFNICVFAYGATGSGKTFTMMGAKKVFESAVPSSFLQISFLEIYAERVRDLLHCEHHHGNKGSSSLRVREHPIRGPYVEGLSLHKVTAVHEAVRLLRRGLSRRMESSTKFHENSSRSHAIFTITLTQSFNGKMPKVSKLNMVDLAGCERIKSCVSKEQVKEGACINRSLSTLGNVICALSEYHKQKHSGSPTKKPFIPYRNSTLTWLLKDSIGGNSKTVMIATVSSDPAAFKQNLSTLAYAQRAQSIVNQPTINEDPNLRMIHELQEEIRRLKCYIKGTEIAEDLSCPSSRNESRRRTDSVHNITLVVANRSVMTSPMIFDGGSGSGAELDPQPPHLRQLMSDMLERTKSALQEGQDKLERTCHMIESQREEYRRLLEVERQAVFGAFGNGSSEAITSRLVFGHHTTSALGSATSDLSNDHEVQRRNYELKINSLENQLATVKQEFSHHFSSAHELIAMQQGKLDDLESHEDNNSLLLDMRNEIRALQQRQESFENFLSQPSPPKSVASSDWAETSSEASANHQGSHKSATTEMTRRLRKYHPAAKMSQSYTGGSHSRSWRAPEATVPKFMTGTGGLSHSYTTGVLSRRRTGGADSVSSNSSAEFGYSLSASGARRPKSNLEVSSRLFPKQDASVPKFSFMRKHEGKAKPVLSFPDYKPPDKNSIKSRLYPHHLEDQVGYQEFLKKYDKNPPSPLDLPVYSPPDKTQIESELYPRHLSDQEPKFRAFLKKDDSRTSTPPQVRSPTKHRRASLRSNSSNSSGFLRSPTGPKPSTSEPMNLAQKSKFSGDSFDGGLETSFDTSRNGARGFETLTSSADVAFGGSHHFPPKGGLNNNFAVEQFLNMTAGWKNQPDYDESPSNFLRDNHRPNDNTQFNRGLETRFVADPRDLAESTQLLIEQSMNDDIFPADYQKQISTSVPLKKVIRQRAEKRFLQRRDSGSSSYSDGSTGVVDEKSGNDGQTVTLIDENGNPQNQQQFALEGFNSSLDSGRSETFQKIISSSRLSKSDVGGQLHEELVKLPPILSFSFKSEQMSLNERIGLLNKPQFDLHDLHLSSHEQSDDQKELVVGTESNMYSKLEESVSEPQSPKTVASEDSIGEVIEYGTDAVEMASERGGTPELNLSLPSASFQPHYTGGKFFSLDQSDVKLHVDRVNFEAAHSTEGLEVTTGDTVAITAEEIHIGAEANRSHLVNNDSESPGVELTAGNDHVFMRAESPLVAGGDDQLTLTQFLSESQISVEGLLKESIGQDQLAPAMPHWPLTGDAKSNGVVVTKASKQQSDSVSSADSQDLLDDSPSKKAVKVVSENPDSQEAHARLGHIGRSDPSDRTNGYSSFNGNDGTTRAKDTVGVISNGTVDSAAQSGLAKTANGFDTDENLNVVDCVFEPHQLHSQWIESSIDLTLARQKSELLMDMVGPSESSQKGTAQARRDSFFDSQTDGETVEDFSYLPKKVEPKQQPTVDVDTEKLKEFVMPSRETNSREAEDSVSNGNEEISTAEHFKVPFDQWHSGSEEPQMSSGKTSPSHLHSGATNVQLNGNDSHVVIDNSREIQPDDRSAVVYESDFETDATENIEESQGDSGIQFDRTANGSAMTERQSESADEFQFRNANGITNEWCGEGSSADESNSVPINHSAAASGPSRDEFLTKPFEADLPVPFIVRKLSQPQIIISLYEDVPKPRSFSVTTLIDQLNEMDSGEREFPTSPSRQEIYSDVPPAEFLNDMSAWVEPIEDEIVESTEEWETASLEESPEAEVVEILPATVETKLNSFVVESSQVVLADQVTCMIKNWHDPGILYRSPVHQRSYTDDNEDSPKIVEIFDELPAENVSPSSSTNVVGSDKLTSTDFSEVTKISGDNGMMPTSVIGGMVDNQKWDDTDDHKCLPVVLGCRLVELTDQLDRNSADLEENQMKMENLAEGEEERSKNESWPVVGESPSHQQIGRSSTPTDTTAVWREPTFHTAYTLCYNDGLADGLHPVSNEWDDLPVGLGSDAIVQVAATQPAPLNMVASSTPKSHYGEDIIDTPPTPDDWQPHSAFSQFVERSKSVERSLVEQTKPIESYESVTLLTGPKVIRSQESLFLLDQVATAEKNVSNNPSKQQNMPAGSDDVTIAEQSDPTMSSIGKEKKSEFADASIAAQLHQWHSSDANELADKPDSHKLELTESSTIITYQHDGTFDLEIHKQWHTADSPSYKVGLSGNNSDSPFNIEPLLSNHKGSPRSNDRVQLSRSLVDPLQSATEQLDKERISSSRTPNYAKETSDNSDSQEEVLNVSFINGVPDEVSLETRAKDPQLASDSSSFVSSDEENVVIQTTVISPHSSQRHRIGVEGADVVLIPLGVQSTTERKRFGSELSRTYVHLSNSFPNVQQAVVVSPQPAHRSRSLFGNELLFNSASAINIAMDNDNEENFNDPNRLEEIRPAKVAVGRTVSAGHNESKFSQVSRTSSTGLLEQFDLKDKRKRIGSPSSPTYVYVHSSLDGTEQTHDETDQDETVGGNGRMTRPNTLPSVRPMFQVLSDPDPGEKYAQDPYGVWRKDKSDRWNDYIPADDYDDDEDDIDRQKKSVSWSDLSGKTLELGPTVEQDRSSGNSPKPIIKPHHRSNSQDSRGAFGTSLSRSDSHSPSHQRTESFRNLNDSVAHPRDKTFDLLNCLHESQQTLNRAISQIVTEAANADSPDHISNELVGLPPQEAAKRLLLRLLLSPMTESRDAAVQTEMAKDQLVVDKTPAEVVIFAEDLPFGQTVQPKKKVVADQQMQLEKSTINKSTPNLSEMGQEVVDPRQFRSWLNDLDALVRERERILESLGGDDNSLLMADKSADSSQASGSRSWSPDSFHLNTRLSRTTQRYLSDYKDQMLKLKAELDEKIRDVREKLQRAQIPPGLEELVGSILVKAESVENLARSRHESFSRPATVGAEESRRSPSIERSRRWPHRMGITPMEQQRRLAELRKGLVLTSADRHLDNLEFGANSLGLGDITTSPTFNRPNSSGRRSTGGHYSPLSHSPVSNANGLLDEFRSLRVMSRLEIDSAFEDLQSSRVESHTRYISSPPDHTDNRLREGYRSRPHISLEQRRLDKKIDDEIAFLRDRHTQQSHRGFNGRRRQLSPSHMYYTNEPQYSGRPTHLPLATDDDDWRNYVTENVRLKREEKRKEAINTFVRKSPPSSYDPYFSLWDAAYAEYDD